MRTTTTAVLLLTSGLLVAGCGGQRTTAAPWNLRGPASGTVLRLEVGVGSSSCDELAHISVREDADEVHVTATVRRTDERDCTADYHKVVRDVQLQQPLGTRRLSGCRPDGPLTVGTAFGGEETESTCFETVRVVGPVGSG